MRQKSNTPETPSERLVRDIRRVTRKQYSAEEKIRIVLDGLRGIPALRGSSKLVRGRWFQTAAVVGTVTLVMQTVGVVVSLLALVAFTGMPLWLLAGLGTFVQLLLVPLCSIVLCLLHGDAVANEREHRTADDADDADGAGTATAPPAAPVA